MHLSQSFCHSAKTCWKPFLDRSFKTAYAAFTTASEDWKRLPRRCFFRLGNRKNHTRLNPDYREGGGRTSHWFVQDIQRQHLRHAASHNRGAASSLLHLNVAFSVWYDLAELSGHLCSKSQLLLCVQVRQADKPFHQYKKIDDLNFPCRRNHLCFFGGWWWRRFPHRALLFALRIKMM